MLEAIEFGLMVSFGEMVSFGRRWDSKANNQMIAKPLECFSKQINV